MARRQSDEERAVALFDPENPYQGSSQLSYPAMVAVLSRGGSVVYRGQVITEIAKLPDAAVLAKGRPDEIAKVKQELADLVRRTEAQIALLNEGVPHAGSTVSAAPGLTPGEDAPTVITAEDARASGAPEAEADPTPPKRGR